MLAVKTASHRATVTRTSASPRFVCVGGSIRSRFRRVVRPMTLRMDNALADEIEVVRRVLDVPAVEIFREAIAGYLEELRDDAEFQALVLARIGTNARALDRSRNL